MCSTRLNSNHNYWNSQFNFLVYAPFSETCSLPIRSPFFVDTINQFSMFFINWLPLLSIINQSWMQFPLQNQGCWHPKNLRFCRAILHPYFATKSKTMGWQAPKNHPFWTCLDCILVGPWFCRQGPQQSAGSAQNLTFWARNWFCRDKACDNLRSLIF